MPKQYGRKGPKQNPMPSSHDPKSELVITTRNGDEYAWGQWESTYEFVLKSNSLIIGRDKAQGSGVKKIIEQLADDSLLEAHGDGDYTLLKDIYLYSPSAA